MELLSMKSARLTGVIGLISLAFFILAVGMIHYLPVGVDNLSIAAIAESKDDWTIFTAVAIILFCAPGMIGLSHHFYIGLRPAGAPFALPAALFFAFSMILAFAANLAIAYSILAMKYGIEGSTPEIYNTLFGLIAGNLQWSLVISTLIAWVAVWWKKTNYPYWVSRTNPLFVIFFFVFISRALPEEIASLYHPNRFYIGIFVFFAISLYALWKNEKIDDPEFQAGNFK